ncbi:MAG: M23 family metallopeptidase, partial [Blastochloris sp.]|nr:M23 family metallopeptidase [Blastochloris sp.]
PPARAGAGFLWPIKGRILASFRTGSDDTQSGGINIAAPKGAPVLAAENGTVLYAGDLKGYGNLLLVRHADGFVTAYAHLDKMLVAKNDRVTRGQRIATVGSTGSVAAPQLHFEIRKDGEPVDPSRYLEPL